MDRNTSRSLTPEEAKARLRAAAQGTSPKVWISQHKWGILAVALAGGFLAGRTRVPIMARAILMQQLTPLLLTALSQKRRNQ